jgi:hypothetical protein
MIALCGDPEDLTTAYVGWQARNRGLDVAMLPEEALGESWALRFDDDRPDRSWLELDGRGVPVESVTGVFVRFNPSPGLPPVLAGIPLETGDLLREERRIGLEYCLDRLPCAVVNRPSAGRSNGSKPYQMRLLETAGFDVPAWLVTVDAEIARAFAAESLDGAIYKSCSGLRSRVRRADDDLYQRLAVQPAPVLLQEYVPGDDVRVHVVGERAFATRIHGAGLDYRYETDGAVYAAIDAPEEIELVCIAAARDEGLALAGFDFRVEPTGRWRCLESNPVPTFLPYEMSTGQPIAGAVIDVLAGSVPALAGSVSFAERVGV